MFCWLYLFKGLRQAENNSACTSIVLTMYTFVTSSTSQLWSSLPYVHRKVIVPYWIKSDSVLNFYFMFYDCTEDYLVDYCEVDFIIYLHILFQWVRKTLCQIALLQFCWLRYLTWNPIFVFECSSIYQKLKVFTLLGTCDNRRTKLD